MRHYSPKSCKNAATTADVSRKLVLLGTAQMLCGEAGLGESLLQDAGVDLLILDCLERIILPNVHSLSAALYKSYRVTVIPHNLI